MKKVKIQTHGKEKRQISSIRGYALIRDGKKKSLHCMENENKNKCLFIESIPVSRINVGLEKTINKWLKEDENGRYASVHSVMLLRNENKEV